MKYHVVHARDWILRMGDGTPTSHEKIQSALLAIWEYTPEMFEMDELDQRMVDAGIGVDLASLRPAWRQMVEAICSEATLTVPADAWGHSGGKRGKHSEHLGFMLADMQFLQRAYPGAKW